MFALNEINGTLAFSVLVPFLFESTIHAIMRENSLVVYLLANSAIEGKETTKTEIIMSILNFLVHPLNGYMKVEMIV